MEPYEVIRRNDRRYFIMPCLVCGERESNKIWCIPKVGLICESCLEIIYTATKEIKEKTGKECIDADSGRGKEIRKYIIEAKIVKVSSEVQEVQSSTKLPYSVHRYEDPA